LAIVEDLIVSERGCAVHLKGRRIRICREEEAPVEVPLLHLRSVQIMTRAASISAAALAACSAADVPVHFIDGRGQHYATLLSPTLTTTMANRRAQFTATTARTGFVIARALVTGKLGNQAANLEYLGRNTEAAQRDALYEAVTYMLNRSAEVETLEAEEIGQVRGYLMGIEGDCARVYWGALGPMIPAAYAWPGRKGRGARDSVNSLLNYGYAILYGEVQHALMLAGLEPYAGLLHTDRSGKPGLTCDLIEEFRAPIVDRVVLGLVRRHFNADLEDDGRLPPAVRRGLAEHILKRLQARAYYDGQQRTLRDIIQLQARLLAAAFRGDQRYRSYRGR
jgi:CRISP-associated protein Cas1